jgi:hypothetical protein
VSLRPPNGGSGEDGATTPVKGDPLVPNPIAAMRNWAIEQVTAIVSVCRPLHLQARTPR